MDDFNWLKKQASPHWQLLSSDSNVPETWLRNLYTDQLEKQPSKLSGEQQSKESPCLETILLPDLLWSLIIGGE